MTVSKLQDKVTKLSQELAILRKDTHKDDKEADK